MAPEPNSAAYYINPSHQSLCLCVTLIVARQQPGKTLLRQRIHTQQKNCWTRRFVYGPFRVKGEWAIISPHNFLLLFKCSGGRTIAQAVSRRLPTAAARVRARVWSCGICGGQSGAGAGFLRVLRFPLPIRIPPVAPQSPSSIIWGLYKRPEVAAVPSGLSPAPLIIIIINVQDYVMWCPYIDFVINFINKIINQ
jgi:hypothetical protein